MKVSVLVTTYNPDIYKLYRTLESIIQQKFDDFEIVVTDDGSKDNQFSKIEEYFTKNEFTNYHLVANEHNQGTVKNILSGLDYVSGKYVKLIGPGDALYDEYTLENVYQFMEKLNCECCFGMSQAFSDDGQGKIHKQMYSYPFDIDAYRGEVNKERIIKNLVLYSDNVCGAAILYKKDFCIEYMNKIKEYVVYEEDIFQVLSAVEGRNLRLYDDYMIWYELGEGISTKKKSKFAELLQKDVNSFYSMLYEKYGDNKYVKKRNKLMPFYKINNLYVRTILRFFVNPDVIRYLIVHEIQKKKKSYISKNKREGFFDKEEFWNNIQ